MDKASYLAAVREEAFTKGQTRFGRGGIPKNRLLDDGDQNIGNAEIVTPQGLPASGAAHIVPNLNPPRILAMDALSPTAQMVTLTFTAAVAQPASGGSSPSNVGPITGIVEFGNGSQFTRLEVDIPVGPYDYVATPSQPRDGGVTLTVPAGTLRAFGRHDGHYVTPSINGIAAGTTPPTLQTVPVLVKAFATYFTRFATKAPTKTLYLGAGSTAAIPGGVGSYSIPPFAKRMRILRDRVNNTTTFNATFLDSFGGNILELTTFTNAAFATFVDIPGTANVITLQNAGGVVDSFLALEFEIQI